MRHLRPIPRDENDLRHQVARHRWSVLAITLIAVATTLIISLRQDPLYQSEAKVLVKPILLSPQDPESAIAPNLETEKGIASSLAVGKRAVERLGTDVDPEELINDVSAEIDVESEILSLTFTDTTPKRAKAGAQAFAQSYLDFRLEESLRDLLAASESLEEEIVTLQEELQRIDRELARTQTDSEISRLETQANLVSNLILEKQVAQVTLPDDPRVGRIVQPALLPDSPSSPNHARAGALGLFLGLSLGVAQAALRGRLDDRFRSQEEIEVHLGTPVLGTIPRVSEWRRSRAASLIVDWQLPSASSEAFRILRTNFLAASAIKRVRSILVTSSRAGEGKTAIAVNLGIALAQSEKRVVIVSADLRKPRLHQLVKQPPSAGLNEVLTKDASIDQALTRTRFPNLLILASDTTAADGAERLGSSSMSALLEELGARADFILLDAAPVSTADTVALTPLVDSVLFVVDAGRTLRGAIGHARRQLDRLGADVVGAVLNRFDSSKISDHSYYHAYYGATSAVASDGDIGREPTIEESHRSPRLPRE